jgi:hypothetical protein
MIAGPLWFHRRRPGKRNGGRKSPARGYARAYRVSFLYFTRCGMTLS